MPDPSHLNPLESWRWYREPFAAHIFQLCREVISGDLRLVDAARSIVDALSAANPWFSDYGHEDFRSISRLAGATLHLPVGAARPHWATDVIRDKESELRAIEEEFRGAVLAEARRALMYAPRA